jgi:DNA polymerase Ligase (LigD)/Helicase conserved C-terminal domain
MSEKIADILPTATPQEHQEHVWDRLSDTDHPGKLLLYHALGSGKSFTGIGAAEQYGHPWAAITPASLRPNMQEERKKFTDQSLPMRSLSYSELARGKTVPEDSQFYDEAHRLRNPGSKATQQALEAAQHAKQLLLATGTPIVNAPGDLAVPLSMLTGKQTTPREFEDRYVGQKAVNRGVFGWLRGVPKAYVPTVSHREELKRLLAGHVDYYAPPQPTVPTTHEDYEVDMGPDQAKLYQAMWERLPWLTRWKLERNYPMSADELARTRSFLTGPRQVGISTYPFMGHRRDAYKAFQGSTKLQKANQLMGETMKDPRTKALVFSNFIDAGLIPYSEGLTRAGVPNAVFHGGLSDIERKKIVDDFNANKLRTVLLGPSGSEGLSFKGVQLVQMLDPYWHGVRGRQAAARGLRFGSHIGLPEDLQNVRIQRFISKMPLNWRARMAERFGLDRQTQRRATDDYLLEMSKHKDIQNQEFLDLLKEVGSNQPKVASFSDAQLDKAAGIPDREQFGDFSDAQLAKAAAPAAGIPDREQFGDLSKLQTGQMLDWAVQHHMAQRAGPHYDVRFGTPETGLYSWAARKGLPAPGEKHLAVQQPLHAHEYGSFEGKIPSGYGAGTVKRHDLGRILLTKVLPNEIHFTTAHQRYPERYLLKQTKDKNWLFINTTPTEPTPYTKERYTSVPSEQVEPLLDKLQPGTSVQAKIDGAATLTKLVDKHFDVISYRASKVTGGPITHTERIFGGRPEVELPREMKGSVLRGETYGTNPQGQAIPPQELGGLLNSAVEKSRNQQQERGTDLKNMLFNIQQYGKTPVPEDTPYAARMEMLKRILPHLPAGKFELPQEATTPDAAKSLWQQVQGGQHPLTREGVVIHPPTGRPMKAKLLDEHDVHLREMFPATQGSKYEGNAVGGFRYSHEPTGPIAGEVGTGLTDELRQAMFKDPESYIGRVAKVRAQEKFPSGALRAPSLLSLHEDYPAAPAVQ